ncbi:MAG TPA: alpha-amylase family glycosyl hydrolase, partial [Halanaerobiales bacterium]|nr:alpha-amylase family glycosyl hydrolase [Halanaerobiales bacterium]
YKEIQKDWYSLIQDGGWITQYLNNHDQPRAVSKFGNDGQYRCKSAKMLATMLLTLPGTPFIYQGEEIGMTNVRLPGIDDYNDIRTINKYKEKIKKGEKEGEILEELWSLSRDNSRTPMQWNSEENAGFSSGVPWLKVNPNYIEINVENQINNPDSILSYYRHLISLRKKYSSLVYGSYRSLMEDKRNIYVYYRKLKNEEVLVIINNFAGFIKLPREKVNLSDKHLLLSNYSVTKDSKETVNLRPYESRVYAGG